jgi:dTDP-4-dehydrorhamnose reductase
VSPHTALCSVCDSLCDVREASRSVSDCHRGSTQVHCSVREAPREMRESPRSAHESDAEQCPNEEAQPKSSSTARFAPHRLDVAACLAQTHAPMRRLRFLVTGATGYLGRALLARAAASPRAAEFELLALPRQGEGALDFARPDSLPPALERAAPDVVLHLAALSTIAGCEREPARARLVNALSTATLCTLAPRVVLASTDLVFGGDRAPYAPGDPPAPLSAYGRSKAEAEEWVLRSPRGVAARLPLLFGPSFDCRRGATDMVRAAVAEGREVALFTDEFRTPLHVVDAADALLAIALDATCRGIVHLGGDERVSRVELGERFVRAAELAGAALRAVPCTDPLRPKDVSLTGSRPAARSLAAALAAS